MSCRHCEHPPAWHGDRAIGGCDAGLSPLEMHPVGAQYMMAKTRIPYGPGRPLCNCPGWSEAA